MSIAEENFATDRGTGYGHSDRTGSEVQSLLAVDASVAGCETLHDLFFRQCRAHATRTAYTFIGDVAGSEQHLTFAQLERRASKLAAALAERAERGARVLLAFDNGPECVELFWASILAGLVPIPAPTPDAHLSKHAVPRLQAILRDSGASLAVTSAARLKDLPSSLSSTWLSYDTLAQQRRLPFHAPTARGGDLAYLQYTSGSTSAPRGVELTHANVLAQCFGITDPAAVGDTTTNSLSWLPWFHDYGLLQGVIMPVYFGRTSYLMQTFTFLRRPLRWLEAVARYRITDSGAPDFAYTACVQALVRQPHWSADLSSWTRATCGAEPIRAETLDAFARAFGPHGFRATSFEPAYGMAEAVLTISKKFGRVAPRVMAVDAAALENNIIHEGAVHADAPVRALVSCGEALPGLEVRVVDPARRVACAANSIGELWVRGSSVGRGYWRQPEKSAATFGGRIDDGSDDGSPFLRTGDLGFMVDGEVFVTGRLKDLIIVHGRNLYPHDLELTAQGAHAGVRTQGVMAFAVERSGGEGVVLVVEVSGRPDPDEVRDIIDTVRMTVGAAYEIEILDVVAVRAGALPRTSSGKPQRGQARQLYCNGELVALAAQASDARAPAPTRDALEALVAETWATVLGPQALAVDADFFSLGGNSLLATQLVSRLNAVCGVEMPIRAVFEAPTVAGLAGQIRTEQTRSMAATSLGPTMASDGAETVAPALSFAQERMWFLHELQPQGTAYHMPLAIRLRGRLDDAALETAFQRVIARHDILRTTFAAEASGIVPCIQPDLTLKLKREHLEVAQGSTVYEALDRRLGRLTQDLFDLERGPLMRLHLLTIAPDDAMLLIVQHHIAGDQWSFAVMAREIAHYYHCIVSGEPTSLPPLPIQYANYAAQHRRWFDGARREKELSYWRETLAGLEPLAIETDLPRPPQLGFRGARVRIPFEAADVAALTALGAKHNASLSMVLIAALKILLFTQTGRRDVAIGVPIANRHHLASESLIGTFVNTLVLRTDLSGEPTFARLLERVRAVSLDAFEHQNMPFEVLIQELDVERDPSRSPFFQVLFNMLNAPVGALAFGDVSWSRLDFDRQSAQFDLSVTVDPTFDRGISFEYATDLFMPETIARLAERYRRLLREIVATPQMPIAQLAGMDDVETTRVLAWGRGRPEPVAAASVCDWLRSSVEARPDACAVTCDGRAATYGYIDGASRLLADALNRRGVGRGQYVGLYATRSIDMVVAQLAVLRAGAAYVPLDPANPARRLAYMASDAGLALILVDAAGAAAPLAWAGAISTLSVADGLAEGQGLAADADTAKAASFQRPGPEDAAYVIYTSGSTGEPKGVVVPHRAVVNFLTSMAREPGLSDSDRLLAVTTLGFDISVLETLLPLGVGAQIVLASREDAANGEALKRLIETHGVTAMQATPSSWNLLIAAGWTGSARFKALVGGEPLPVELARHLTDRCGEVWNMYGPTETTVWSTCARVGDVDQLGVSIGRPIANTQIYVLHDDLSICAPGVAGELYIGGAGVAHGYLNRPDLTQRQFVADPFSAHDNGARVYRTGDRARWRADGTLEHKGRLDFQIKLRGSRIEAGEIEVALTRHPHISRALAMVREDHPGDPRLVAYVETNGGATSRAMLREHLRSSLPDSMLPQHYVTLDALPLTANGKIDRKALPQPHEEHDEAAVVAPRNAAERAMCKLWRTVLNGQVGVHDNFFDLGGHSMLAVRLVHKIGTDLGIDCQLPMLFRHPTVASLCEALDSSIRLDSSSAIALQSETKGPALFCICGIHIYQELADELAADLPVFGVFVPCEIGFLDAGADPHSQVVSVAHLAADYIEAIKAQQPHGPYYLAGVSFGGLLAFEIAQQLRRQGEVVAFLAMFDTSKPEDGFAALKRMVKEQVRRIRQRGPKHLVRAAQSLIARLLNSAYPATDAFEPTDPTLIEDHARTSVRDAIYRKARKRYTVLPYHGSAIVVHADDGNARDHDLGWTGVVDTLEVVSVKGGHLEILKRPNVRSLVEKIRPHLERQRAGNA